jgi:hypothetical protein
VFLFHQTLNASLPQEANLSAFSSANNPPPNSAVSLRLFSVHFFENSFQRNLNHKNTAPAIITNFHHFFMASTCAELVLSIIHILANPSTSRSHHLSNTELSFL